MWALIPMLRSFDSSTMASPRASRALVLADAGMGMDSAHSAAVSRLLPRACLHRVELARLVLGVSASAADVPLGAHRSAGEARKFRGHKGFFKRAKRGAARAGRDGRARPRNTRDRGRPRRRAAAR